MAIFSLDELEKYKKFITDQFGGESNKSIESKKEDSNELESTLNLPLENSTKLPSWAMQSPEEIKQKETASKGAELAKTKDQQLKELEYMLGMPLTDSSQLPFAGIQKPKEIKSVQEQKETPVEKSKISTGLGEAEPTKTRASSLKEVSIPTQKEEIIEEEKKINFYDLLEKAKEARDSQILMANLGKAAETLASGLSGTVRGGVVTKPTGADFYDKLIKQAEQKIEDVGTAYTLKTKQDELERLARRRDPASEESKFARELLKSQGIAVPENATAEMLEKYAPQISNIYTQREAAKSREAIQQSKAEDKSLLMADKKASSAQQFVEKAGDVVLKSKITENKQKVDQAADRINFAITNPSAVGDITVLYDAIKLLDPSSAVRPGEVELLQQASNLFNRLKLYTSDFTSKKRLLTKDVLMDMKNLLDITKGSIDKQYNSLVDRAVDNAVKRGYDKYEARLNIDIANRDKLLTEKEQPKGKVSKHGIEEF